MAVELKDLEDCFITFKEPREALIICDILSNEGYGIFGRWNVESDCMNWKGFEYDPNHNEFDLSNDDSQTKFKIGFNEFLSLFDIQRTDSKRRKIKKPKEDPFGEETWWEQVEEGVKFNLDEYFITYDTREEAIDISKWLVSLGYDVYDLEGVGDPDWHKYKGFCLSSSKRYFVQTKEPENEIILTYDDFVELVNKKRIKNIEIDPFDEENWGFEKESKNENFSYTSKRHIHRFPL